jgi:hypothetical protein
MTDQIENLILEHLKAMRAQLNRIEADIAGRKGREHTHEPYLSALHSDTARQSGRLDEPDARRKRIERRLELADEQPQ